MLLSLAVAFFASLAWYRRTKRSPTFPPDSVFLQIKSLSDQANSRSVPTGNPLGDDTTLVVLDTPRIVVADFRLDPRIAPHFLYLPHGRRDMVFIDRIDHLSFVATWDVWTRPPPSRPRGRCFRISDCPGKGLGMFATRAIRKGELVIDERPVYVARKDLHMAPDQIDDRHSAFYLNAMRSLSSEASESIMSLSNAKPLHSVCAPLGILRTNYLQIDVTPIPDPASPYHACFPTLSRANHSCSPSANYHFLLETFSGQIFATRDIAKGEEITVPYCDLLAPAKERQEYVRSAWNFTCTCETCSLPLARRADSDERRRKLSSLMQHIQRPTVIATLWSMAVGSLSEEAVGWAEEEDLMVVKAHVLLYTSSMLGRRLNAGAMIQSLQKAREAFVVVEGERSHNVRRTDSILLRARQFGAV